MVSVPLNRIMTTLGTGGAFAKFENYATGEDGSRKVGGVNWSGQTFKPATTHTIGRVVLTMYRVGTPGDVTVAIRATTTGLPSGADLTSVVIDGDLLPTISSRVPVNLDFAGILLTAATTYAIIWRAVTTSMGIITDDSSPTYTDGSRVDSANSGGTWAAVTTTDHLFEEWGTP